MRIRALGIALGIALAVTACGGGGSSGTPVALPYTPSAGPATPTPTLTPTPTAAPMRQTAKFDLVANGGYTETATLDVGTVQHFRPDLRKSTEVLCTIDPQKDAVIPMRLTVTETTPGTLALGQDVVLRIDNNLYVMSVEEYTTPGQCSRPENSKVGPTVGVGKNQNSRTSSISALLVIYNFYTPDHPDGNLTTFNAPASVTRFNFIDGEDKYTGVVQEPDRSGWLTLPPTGYPGAWISDYGASILFRTGP
jgi:hypothetical protein